jgi:hypothetical protein
MTELIYPVPRSYFMSLCDGFPVPAHKAVMIRQLIGKETLPYEEHSEDDGSKYSPFSSVSCSDSVYCSSLSCCGHSTTSLDNNAKETRSMSEIVIEVHNIGLIPSSVWAPQNISLKDLRNKYFIMKNGACRQFDIKLYNALRITKYYPEAVDFVGVSWVDSTTFKVNAKVFASFFGVKTIFHKQGWFSRYSFEQVYKNSELSSAKNWQTFDVDDENICLFRDTLNRFSREKKYHCVLY